MARSSKSVEKIEASSGNVFADLGLPDAAQRDTKVRLTVAINRQLKSRRLTQAVAALMRDAAPAEFWCRRPGEPSRFRMEPPISLSAAAWRTR